MRKVILLRGNQILSSTRVEKYISFYKEKDIEYQVFGWDKLNAGLVCENTTFYRRKVGHISGGFKAAYNRMFWFRFILRKLLAMKKEPMFIHACDLDAALPVAIYKALFNKEVYLVFDVCDWLSHVLSSKTPKIILRIVNMLEKYTLRHADKIIICEEERRQQIKNSENYDILVLPNIPMNENTNQIMQLCDEYNFDNDKLTLSYVGWFGGARFLDELLEVAEKGLINLLIAGFGYTALEDKCNQLNGNGNVKYFGRVSHAKGLQMMYNSDAVFAMYCKVCSNHYFAAPNKYYEAMFLGRPIITTKGIIVGDKVEKENIGYTIEETMEELVSLVSNMNKADMQARGRNAERLWDNKYSTYTHDFLENKYLPLIKQ